MNLFPQHFQALWFWFPKGVEISVIDLLRA